MRYIGVLLLAASVLAGGCQSGGTSDMAPPTGPIVASSSGSATATLIVHGLGCPLCAHNIDKQLLALPGVETVRVDLGSGSVFVTMAAENGPTSEQLAAAVEQSGYTLVRIDR